jgi:hypothetical protein
MGVRGLLVYCSDYHCSHWGKITADQWPDELRLSDLEPLFVCQACGVKGAELRRKSLTPRFLIWCSISSTDDVVVAEVAVDASRLRRTRSLL